MILPIVSRELRLRARMPATPYLRMAAALAMIVLVIPLLTVLSSMPGINQLGTILFQMTSWILLIFVLVEGIRVSAGVISEERRDGTLGLLFLTDLSPHDILLGKLAGSGLTAFYGLLATLPVLALPVLVGGVTAGELLRGAINLLNALFLTLALGLWASARSRESWTSLVTGYGAMLALILVAPLAELTLQGYDGIDFSQASIGLLSPALTLNLASDTEYSAAPVQFWLAQLLQPTAAAALLARAGALLRRTWREPMVPSASPAARPHPTLDATPATGAPARAPARPRPKNTDPITAGLVRDLRLGVWTRVLVGLEVLHLTSTWIFLLQIQGTAPMGPGVASLVFLFQIPAVLAGFAGMLLLAHLAARAFGDGRASGELELLLTTPLPERDMLTRVAREFHRIVVILSGLALLNGLAVITVARGLPNGPVLDESIVRFVTINALSSVLDTGLGSAALVWVGLRFGLTQRRVPTAAGWAFGLVGIATPMAGHLILVQASFAFRTLGPAAAEVLRGIQIAALAAGYACWIAWARKGLRTSFRTAVAGGA